jgi:nitrous oxidase accessory protein
MKRVIAAITAILLFLPIFASFQTGRCEETTKNIFYVGGTEPENYSSIQNAIDNASDGDTIFVYNGIYNENIIVNKTIDLIGENKENTIINGYINEIYENFLIAFYILADQVNLSSFTITNSILEYDLVDSSIYRIGILIKANNTTIEDNIIKENTFGISLDNSFSNKIISNILMDNYIQINLLGSSENIIENNNITNLNLNPNIFLHLNENIGISLDLASNNTIVNNSISSISGTAIKLSYLCQNNLLYYNNLIKNTENANDSGNNSWDNGQYGNFWDDYNESDMNNDGIGDLTYNIPNGNNKDRYPLMMPYDGTFRLKEFYVDLSSVITMLIVGMILIIIFLIPIAYFWNKKTK